MTIRILVVEDDPDVHLFYQASLKDLADVELVCASTRVEAMHLFMENPDFAAIVMDACVPGSAPNTLGLVYNFRRTFQGPMIATSSEPKYNDMLVEVGCDHKSPKNFLPQALREILGLK